MVKKIKYGKIAAVIFLTVLIWAWADLAKTEEYPVYRRAAITVAESASPNLWVSFDDRSSVLIEQIVLKGPASKIAELRREIETRERHKQLSDDLLSLQFVLVPELERMTEPGGHPLNVLNFLKKSERVRRLGLTVESCEPDTLNVQVVELVEKLLTVECRDERGIPLRPESTEPAVVSMFVPKNRSYKAIVKLSPEQITKARLSAVKETPYIDFPPGQATMAPRVVKITMPPEEDPRKPERITSPKLMTALSMNLLGEYTVKVTNWNDVVLPIAIRATPEAKKAYQSQRCHMTLYIFDGDENEEGEQSREVFYNLPEEFVRKGEIELDKSKPLVKATFKVVPLFPAAGP